MKNISCNRKGMIIAAHAAIIFCVFSTCFVFITMNVDVNGLERADNIILYSLVLMTNAFLGWAISSTFYKRHENAEKLRLSSRIFQNTVEAIIVTDDKTRIIYANDAFTKITGYKDKEVLGRKTSYFKSGIHEDEFYKNMWKSINEYGSWQGEVWDKKKDGHLYPKWLKINSIKGISGTTKYIGVFEDLTDKKRINQHVKKLENYDVLTGLPNHALFSKIIDRYIERGFEFSLISLKITNFSLLNESLGYKYGEELLVEFTKRLKSVKKKGVAISRTGKDEFAVFCEKEDTDIMDIGKGIIEKLSEIYTIGEKHLYLNITGGVASDKDSKEVSGIIESANIAREYAIENGIGIFEFNKKMRSKYIKRIEIESRLKKALEKDEFKLYYQPQIDIESGKINGVEALIRWESPDLGRVSPAEFIPSAEKTGIIVPLGEWIISQAVRQQSLWADMGIDLNMAINISPVQFKKDDIPSKIEKALEEYGVCASKLEIEITEGLLIENLSKVDDQLARVKQSGAMVAIDDFGTGYSSLAYLKSLDVDKIKIDMQFIRGYPHNDDGSIARIIANLAQNLNLKLTAEGVETDCQLEFVKEIGCNNIQGYYYSPPLQPEDVEKLINGWSKPKKI